MLNSDRYSALAKATGDIVWTNSAEGEMRGPQPEWCAYTGQTEEEAQGYGWSTAVHPDDVKPTMDAWTDAVANRSMFVFEHRVRHHEGAFRWFAVRAVPVLEPGGSIREWVGVHRDIEQEKAVAHAFAKERAVLEAVFREAPVGLALLDEQFRFVRLNAVMADTSGLPMEAHLGRPAVDVLPGLAPSMLDQWQQVLLTGTPILGAEIVGASPNAPKRMRTWKASYFPVRVNDRTVGVGNVIDDITEEKQIAEERRLALTSLELMAETSAALSSSLDYEETLGSLAKIVVPRFADMCTVYAIREDGTPEQVAALHVEDDKVEVLRALYTEERMGADRPLGYRNVIRTGAIELISDVTDEHYKMTAGSPAHLALLRELAPTSWLMVPLKVQDRTLGALAFATRASRRYTRADVPLAEEIGRRAAIAMENSRLYRNATLAVEAERRARDKAEEATRLKDEFLATLSHELRTPLNAILGWARMLQTNSLEESKKPKAIDTIVRNAVAQNQLIEDLLDVSRIITGKLRLNVEPVDINHIVELAIDVVRPAAEAKSVRLQAVLNPDAGLIAGDAGRLQQVFWNLLSNAVKFTPRGGRVHISLRREHSSVELSIADTGAGISAEFLPYVFDRFRQEDGAMTRKAGGLGLGLAIVKHLVELHGGRVTVHSDGENKGSTFVVTLPITPIQSGTAKLPIAERPRDGHAGALRVTCPPELEGLKVLVIDDEADSREVIRAALEHCHAVVTLASSVPEALAALRHLRPDVIVSDIGMPGEDGYSFIRKLRALPREEGGRTPALALTAYARPEDRTRALVEGFQNHAAKPIEPQELLIVIANLAGRYS